MPVYQVRDPAGQLIEIKGDKPPTRDIVEGVFTQAFVQEKGGEEQFAEALSKGIGEATQGQEMSFEDVKPESQLDREAEIEFRNVRRRFSGVPWKIPERLLEYDEKGKPIETHKTGLSFGEKTSDVFLTEDVTEDPEAHLGGSVMGLLSFPARVLGAAVLQGDVSEESTKLWKGTIRELNDWAKDRRNRNVNADVMIGNLQKALDMSRNMPPAMLEEIQDEIDRLEDSKNSGVLTTATQVLGNFGLETASDPMFLFDFGANLKNLLKSGVGTSTRAGIKGAIAETKAAEKKAIQEIAETKLGTSKAGKVEEFVEAGGGKGTVERLKAQGVDIDEAGISVPEGAFSGQVGKIRKQGKLRDEAAEKQLLSAKEQEVAEATAELKGETGAIRERARVATEEAPAKIGVAEADVDVSDLDRSIKDFRESLTKERKPIEELNLVDKVRATTKLKPEHKKEIIRDLLKANSGEIPELDDIVSTITEGSLIKDVISGTRRSGKPVLSKGEVQKVLRDNDFRKGADDLADAILFINQGDLEGAKKVIDRLDELLVSAVKPTAKQKAIEAASPARTIKGKIAEFSDDVLQEKVGDEMFKEFKDIEKLGGKKFGAEKTALKAFNISPTEKNILEFGGKTEAVKKMRKAIEDEAKDFLSNGLKDTDSMKEGEWEQWKKFLGKDFRKDIRVKGAKLAEGDIKKAIESQKLTEDISMQAKDVDVILGTNYAKKIENIQKRGEAAKAATATRLPVKRLVKGFEDRIKAINKRFTKKLGKLEPSQNDQITQILKVAKTGDDLEDTKAMTAALKNKFLDAVEDVADGQKNALSLQVLRKIDGSLGTNYEKMAKDAGRAAGFNLDVMGKVRRSSSEGGGIPSVSVSVAGALGGPAAVKAAGVSQLARKVAVGVKGRKAERALKEIFKLKKASAKRSSELRKALKDVRDGKDVIERELMKGDVLRNIDALVSKGIVPINSLKGVLSQEQMDKLKEEHKNTPKLKNLLIRIERSKN